MVTNITNLTNSETIGEVMIYANQVTNQAFGVFFILSFFFIILFGLKKYGGVKSFTVSSFVSAIVCFFLTTAGFVPTIFLFAFAIFTAIGMLMAFFNI